MYLGPARDRTTYVRASRSPAGGHPVATASAPRDREGWPYGKKGKYRIVPLSDRLRRLFEPYFVIHSKFPYGKRQIQKVVKRVANRARISRECTPHVLRHTFAVLCIQHGLSTRSLQQILGHDHLSTTEIYLNMSPEETLREFHRKW